MKFGRNKTRKRVVLKIAFVWLLSIAMGLPLSLMYSAVSMFCWQQNAILLWFQYVCFKYSFDTFLGHFLFL